jgi:hypothetical protein
MLTWPGSTLDLPFAMWQSGTAFADGDPFGQLCGTIVNSTTVALPPALQHRHQHGGGEDDDNDNDEGRSRKAALPAADRARIETEAYA